MKWSSDKRLHFTNTKLQSCTIDLSTCVKNAPPPLPSAAPAPQSDLLNFTSSAQHNDKVQVLVDPGFIGQTYCEAEN